MNKKILGLLFVIGLLTITFGCVSNAKKAEEYFNEGLTLYYDENYSGAIVQFDRAIQLNPKNKEAWNYKGNALFWQGKYSEAIICYNKAIEIDPNYANAQNNKENTLERIITNEQAATPQSQVKIYSIGQTTTNGNLQFTLNSVRWDKGTDYFKPKENEKWLILDCTVKNISNRSQNLSSMLMFDLYDVEGYSKDISLTAKTNGQLDGEIGPGRMIRGEIAYIIDINDNGPWELIFDFEPLSSGGQVIYNVNERYVK